MVKKLTLEEEIEMLKKCINNLSEDELREAINRNYVDYNKIYKESDRNRLLKEMEQWTWIIVCKLLRRLTLCFI